MAGGHEYSASQRKIINRYYDNLDTILATRLGEIVTDMALAAGDEKKLARLWKRAEQAIEKSKINAPGVSRVINERDIEGLAHIVNRSAR